MAFLRVRHALPDFRGLEAAGRDAVANNARAATRDNVFRVLRVLSGSIRRSHRALAVAAGPTGTT